MHTEKRAAEDASAVAAWLARAAVVDGAKILRAVRALGSPDLLQRLPERGLVELGLPAGDARRLSAVTTAQVEADRRWLLQEGICVVPIWSAKYPRLLLEIATPPAAIYIRGDCRLLDTQKIAIVGSRAATATGRERAMDFATELARAGVTVVSGLALGIDTCAHLGAMEQGSTVAVIGTGLDRTYPRSNTSLSSRIAREGLLLSEFPPGSPPRPHHFPRRNRILSGLCRGVLVIEASLRSGSLITARLAAEQGREVFAVPGSIDNPLSRGCHRLLRDGAKLVESVTDIVEEFPGHSWSVPGRESSPPLREDFHGERAEGAKSPVLEAVGFDPVTLDTLVERSGLTAKDLSSILLRLELRGSVQVLPDGRFVRAKRRGTG